MDRRTKKRVHVILHHRHFSINLQLIAAAAVNKIDSRRALCMCESQLTCVQERGKSASKLKHIWDIFCQMIYLSNWQGNKQNKYHVEA